jgi:hypothetical protein
MKGVPMGVIAAQLGHSDTRMTEKHYAHLSPSYVAETVRANMPDLGIVTHSKNEVVPLVRALPTLGAAHEMVRTGAKPLADLPPSFELL